VTDLGFSSPGEVNPPRPVELGVQSAIPVFEFPLYAKFLSNSYFSGTSCIFAVSYCWDRPIYTALSLFQLSRVSWVNFC